MAKYLVLYRSTAAAGEQMAASTPEQAQEGMQLWMTWFEKAGKAVVDFGSPVEQKQLVPKGGADTGTPVGGFTILEADSTKKVGELLADHPHLHSPGAVIEVLEFLPMPGM